jgi:hypothetical protein
MRTSMVCMSAMYDATTEVAFKGAKANTTVGEWEVACEVLPGT